MPKRTDIKKILVVGAGPIIIGQACEFDYSGTQACKALKDEGYKVILINSNPATIMTDPGVADKTYIMLSSSFQALATTLRESFQKPSLCRVSWTSELSEEVLNRNWTTLCWETIGQGDGRTI